MLSSVTSRCLLLAAVAVLLCSGASAASVQPGVPHRVRAAARAGAQPSGPGQRRSQEHLAQWMQQHSNLSLAEQQRALENEPGFRNYPAETQQRLHDRLTQLNNMSPERRRRMLEHTEAMERLTPPQRQQVRGALQQLGSLPEDRRRLVSRAFRDLREMPQPQRQAILNSERFRGQFTDQERSTLSNLLNVEPYLPVQRPNDTPVSGK